MMGDARWLAPRFIGRRPRWHPLHPLMSTQRSAPQHYFMALSACARHLRVRLATLVAPPVSFTLYERRGREVADAFRLNGTGRENLDGVTTFGLFRARYVRWHTHRWNIGMSADFDTTVEHNWDLPPKRGMVYGCILSVSPVLSRLPSLATRGD